MRVERGARLVLTTPSANRVHTMRGGKAEICQTFRVESGGSLEVWPELSDSATRRTVLAEERSLNWHPELNSSFSRRLLPWTRRVGRGLCVRRIEMDDRRAPRRASGRTRAVLSEAGRPFVDVHSAAYFSLRLLWKRHPDFILALETERPLPWELVA